MPIKAFAAKGPKQRLEKFEYEPGPLKPDEVEVKVTHCGICYSDVGMIDDEFHFSAYPLVPGHEVIGTIAAVGNQVRGLKIGQRVGVGWQCASCAECEYCQVGKEHLCAKEQDTIVHHHGGFADAVRVQARFAIAIPDALDSADAGPLMCAGNTVFAPMLRYNVTATMRTAVAGMGGLGHLAVQYLNKFGCDVTAISSTHSKEDEAKRLGAHHFIATADQGALAKAQRSFDFIISTASADLNWGEYLAALRPNGRLVICGIPKDDLKLSAFALIGNEKSISGGRTGPPSETTQMLEFSARHKVKPMIEKFPMADINAAIDRVRSGKVRYCAVLVA